MGGDGIERRVKEVGQQAYDEVLREGRDPEFAEQLRRKVEQGVRQQERIGKALHAHDLHYYGSKGPGASVH